MTQHSSESAGQGQGQGPQGQGSGQEMGGGGGHQGGGSCGGHRAAAPQPGFPPLPSGWDPAAWAAYAAFALNPAMQQAQASAYPQPAAGQPFPQGYAQPVPPQPAPPPVFAPPGAWWAGQAAPAAPPPWPYGAPPPVSPATPMHHAQHHDLLTGLLVGAAAAYLLSNENVQRTLIRSLVSVWSTFQGGVEELKERVRDAEAEMRHAAGMPLDGNGANGPADGGPA